MKSKGIRCLVVRVGQDPVVELVDGFEGIAEIVGGLVEPVQIGDAEFCVNEEGKLIGLPSNRRFPIPFGDVIAGDFVVCGPGFTSLRKGSLSKFQALLTTQGAK